MKWIIRTIGFASKEIREVIRQPSLILTLILGPFLILFLFGVGHSPIEPPLRTVMVVPDGVQLPVPADQYQTLFGPSIELVGTVTERSEAEQRLVDRSADIAVIIPPDLYDRLAAGEQGVVTVAYDQVDPTMSNYIRFIASAQVSQMNSKILEGALKQSAGPQGDFAQFTANSDQAMAAVQSDLSKGDTASADARLQQMDSAAASLEARLEAVSRFLSPATGSGQVATSERIAATRAALQRYRADIATLRRDVSAGSPAVPEDIALVHADAEAVSLAGGGLGDVPARIIAEPLASNTSNLAPNEPDFVSFYAPAVLALLLQHIAVSFGALSMVRERLFGATELFRVAPVTALQIIVGKYAAYLLMGCFIAAALTVLIVSELNVPFMGSNTFFAAAVVALLLASLGVGFCISLVSGSERQAVQFSMLVLIASVFFSGFFLRLETFQWPTRAVAYALPVTYGLKTLQDVMLRGDANDYLVIAPLTVLALVLFILAILLLRRELRRAKRA